MQNTCRRQSLFTLVLFLGTASLTACAPAPRVKLARLQQLVREGQIPRAVAHCRRAPDPELVTGLARAVLRRELHHQDAAVRASALAVARGLRGQRLDQELRRRLRDGDPLVRARAAAMLAHSSGGLAILTRLLDSPHAAAHATALRRLVRLRGAAALPLLSARVQHRQVAVRQAAIQGLGIVGRGPRELKLLLAATEDAHLGVRLAAVQALGRRPQGEVRAVLGRLCRGADPYLALHAGLALARQGDRQPLQKAVVRGLLHKRWTVRAAALNAAISAGQRMAPAQSRRALDDTRAVVRLTAARALFDDPGLRLAALGAARAVHAKACGAGRTRPWLCLQAAEIMTRAEMPAGASTLDRLFRRSGRPPLRAAALGTLLLLRRDRDLALEALADASPVVRLTAVRWLLQGTGA